ncbi:MAG: adenosine deaminase [Bacteroidales bacterium]|nr:adenosine deaminase [Bacteroidales bacterium]
MEKQSELQILSYINQVPKAELHIHIEGSFEPELMFEIANRNGIAIPYSSVGELRSAYKFGDLQDFLDIYYQGASVLLKTKDFYDLTYQYLRKAANDNIVHTEIFFDPQTHTQRDISLETVVSGITSAMEDAQKDFGISSYLILSFLRHLSEREAFEVLDLALPWKDKFIGVGLDSSERGNPPEKFARVFEKCRQLNLKVMAHAGEEGPWEYVADALDVLHVNRIDHGNRSMDNLELLERLSREKIPLTLCPLSNLKLKVISKLSNHPVKMMMEKGLIVTLNSDDPAYFGGYLNKNYFETAKALNLNMEDIKVLAINSFKASFLPLDIKKYWIEQVEVFHKNFKP